MNRYEGKRTENRIGETPTQRGIHSTTMDIRSHLVIIRANGKCLCLTNLITIRWQILLRNQGRAGQVCSTTIGSRWRQRLAIRNPKRGYDRPQCPLEVMVVIDGEVELIITDCGVDFLAVLYSPTTARREEIRNIGFLST